MDDSENELEIVSIDNLKHNGLLIKNVVNQTIEKCLIAVKQNANALMYIKKPNEEIYLSAVKQNGLILKLINKQTDKICLSAIKQNPMALQYVKHQKESMILYACEKNAYVVTMIKNPNINLYRMLFDINIHTFKYMNYTIMNPEFIDELWNKSIVKNGLLLEKCPHQTFELCKIAIEQNPHALKYINYDILSLYEIHELYTIASIKDGMTIQYMKNYINEEIIKLGIKQNGLAIQFIINPSYELCKLAIAQNSNSLIKINNLYYKSILSNDLYQQSFDINHEDTCLICYSDEIYFIKYQCKHFFCRDCTVKIDKCPMCRLDILNVKLIKK